ncbi:Mitochondrial-processing peptidase subunit alpha [Diplonema papillatum]|nr:Mitochondrial-processing peptidase subunit alpha [Diplonema papillatum]|eukprot:gene16441-25201_t
MLRRTATKLVTNTAPRTTTLNCGVKIVTFNELATVSSIGMFSKIGSRYENEEFKGCGRLLEKMAYNVTSEGSESFIQVPGQINVVNQREVMIYRTDCLRWEAEGAFDLLFRMAVNPEITDATIEAGRALAISNVDTMKREPVKILFELLHQAAWQGNTLGNPSFDPDDTFASITPELLHRYLAMLCRPERLTVVARGVEHDDMVAIAEKRFEPFFKSAKLLDIPPELEQPAKYTGGVRHMENLVAPSSFQKFYEKNNTHIGVLFEGVPIGHEDYHVLMVTQSLLGGGMSFSAGGPGKGMLTKLYRECLCRFVWLDGIEAISAGYSDTGTLGIYGQAEHEHSPKLFDELIKQVATIPDGIGAGQVAMARNQHLAQVLMSVEERGVSVEDLGRQIAVFGSLPSTEELKEAVHAVTPERIQDFVYPRLHREPTVSIYGNVSNVEGYDDVAVVKKKIMQKMAPSRKYKVF